MKRIVVRH